jgi:hypothetical protein
MIAYVTAIPGNRPTRQVEAQPECGVDFCDSCGDCLVCNIEDPCHESESGEHFWVVYADRKPERAEAVLNAD